MHTYIYIYFYTEPAYINIYSYILYPVYGLTLTCYFILIGEMENYI